MSTHNGPPATRSEGVDFDAVVVGAGFSGLYLIHKLRSMGFSVRCFESADGVGGTWYWNRYPGARCDIPTTDYTFSFDPELEDDWEWSEKYATQPEILSYLNHVADRYDLRPDIQFSTTVDSATWDENGSRWILRTSPGNTVTCRFYIMATGCLSMPKVPDIEGTDRFGGEVYYTSSWPHEGVDFSGKRVGVIGTGSSGVQSIPLIAERADQLTVFQRTANFSIPAHNGPASAERLERLATDRETYREEGRWSRAGVPMEQVMTPLSGYSEEEIEERLEAMWQRGELLGVGAVAADVLANLEANARVSEFVRTKIRSIVEDPDVAEALCPTTYPIGTKRACLDTNYYETYNLPHVRLVDLRKTPIETVTETGIDTAEESFEFDAIVYATGFDAMTGALVAVDIEGRDGITLKQKWADGPHTYLGLTSVGFPNLFMITGPGSPSVLSNMAVSIEQHVEWVSECLDYMRANELDVIEPTPTAEEGWGQHVNDCANITLFPQADSWYMGANVPGKPRVFLPYIGGVDTYRRTCDTVAEQDYLGFLLSGSAGERCNDGVVNRLMPDVMLVLQAMAEMELPPLETLPVDDARAFMEQTNLARPPGPGVGEIVDGVLPGAAGDLPYRLYRPPTDGPHPLVVYFHGGGWVLGSHDSDDPLCRDLCLRSDAVIVSVNYRHAPEDRFPAAADDALAATRWVAAHAADLGGIPGRLAVSGWSAGGNLAAVTCQRVRDEGGPEIAGQVLLSPVTDCDFGRDSYIENADGYVLTTALMEWFWNHYADPTERTDPKASPLRAADLSGLPPALIVVHEFDPLRDEGIAYADALAAAGVPARHVLAEGHTHTSLTMVDMVVTGVDYRAQMAEALREFLGAPVAAAAAN